MTKSWHPVTNPVKRQVFGDRCGPLSFTPSLWVNTDTHNAKYVVDKSMLCTNFQDIKPALKFFGELRLDWLSIEFPSRQDFREWRRQVLRRIHPDKGTSERVGNDVFYAFKTNSSMFIRFLENLDEHREDTLRGESGKDDVFHHNAMCWKRKRSEINDRYDDLIKRFGDSDLRASIGESKKELKEAVRVGSQRFVTLWTDTLETQREQLDDFRSLEAMRKEMKDAGLNEYRWKRRRLTSANCAPPLDLRVPPHGSFKPAQGSAFFWSSMHTVYSSRFKTCRAQADRLKMFIEFSPACVGGTSRASLRLEDLERSVKDAYDQCMHLAQVVSQARTMEKRAKLSATDSTSIVAAPADDDRRVVRIPNKSYRFSEVCSAMSNSTPYELSKKARNEDRVKAKHDSTYEKVREVLVDPSSSEGAIRWAVRCADMMAYPEEFDRSCKAIKKLLEGPGVKPSMVGRRGACVDYVRTSDAGPEMRLVGGGAT